LRLNLCVCSCTKSSSRSCNNYKFVHAIILVLTRQQPVRRVHLLDVQVEAEINAHKHGNRECKQQLSYRNASRGSAKYSNSMSCGYMYEEGGVISIVEQLYACGSLHVLSPTCIKLFDYTPNLTFFINITARHTVVIL
jgi:hypothetical protein